MAPAQVQDHEGPGPGLISRAREEERHEPEDSEPPPKPSIPGLATACLTVEDPYFGSPDRTLCLAEPSECLMEDLFSCHAPALALNDHRLALDPPGSGKPLPHVCFHSSPPHNLLTVGLRLPSCKNKF